MTSDISKSKMLHTATQIAKVLQSLGSCKNSLLESHLPYEHDSDILFLSAIKFLENNSVICLNDDNEWELTKSGILAVEKISRSADATIDQFIKIKKEPSQPEKKKTPRKKITVSQYEQACILAADASIEIIRNFFLPHLKTDKRLQLKHLLIGLQDDEDD